MNVSPGPLNELKECEPAAAARQLLITHFYRMQKAADDERLYRADSGEFEYIRLYSPFESRLQDPVARTYIGAIIPVGNTVLPFESSTRTSMRRPACATKRGFAPQLYPFPPQLLRLSIALCACACSSLGCSLLIEVTESYQIPAPRDTGDGVTCGCCSVLAEEVTISRALVQIETARLQVLSATVRPPRSCMQRHCPFGLAFAPSAAFPQAEYHSGKGRSTRSGL